MLEQISWGNYLAGTATVLFCYYATVAATCYRSEIHDFLRRRRAAESGEQSPPSEANKTEDSMEFEALELTVSKINSILKTAGKEVEKPQLLSQLRAVTTGYDGLRKPAFKAAVFNHITKQAEEICGVRISADELEG